MTTNNRLIKEDSINSEELLENAKYAIRHLFWTQANNLLMPVWFLETILTELRSLKQPYVVVSQLPNKNPVKDKFERKVTEVYKK